MLLKLTNGQIILKAPVPVSPPKLSKDESAWF